MKSVRVSEKGQVTIPKALRDRLGIRAGERVEFQEEGGRVILSKSSPRDSVDELYGILELPLGTDDFVSKLRDPTPG